MERRRGRGERGLASALQGGGEVVEPVRPEPGATSAWSPHYGASSTPLVGGVDARRVDTAVYWLGGNPELAKA